MRGRSFVAVAMAAVLGWAGTASAANPGQPSPPGQAQTPPGQEHTPPGQEKKAEADAGNPSPAGQQQEPPGQSAKSVETPASPAPQQPAPHAAAQPEPARASHVTVTHANVSHAGVSHVETTRGHPAAPTASQAAVAHTHVILCHRTGSSSNPYVVINISTEAWLHGHSTHPALGGNDDIVLKVGATPGEKLPVSSCPRSAAATSTVKPTETHPQTRSVPTPVKPQQQHDPATPHDPSAPRGAAVAPSPGADAHPVTRSGVAAEAVGAVATGVLPFTGMPIWVAALLGVSLIGSGLALRKAFYDAGPREDPAFAHISTASRTGAGSSRS